MSETWERAAAAAAEAQAVLLGPLAASSGLKAVLKVGSCAGYGDFELLLQQSAAALDTVDRAQ